MGHRHAICLVVDGLRAAALGVYGNTSYPTPQLDALASRALVAEWMWADSPHLAGFYRSAWHRVHAIRPPVADRRQSIIDQLHQGGVRQWLLTDDPWLSARSADLPFDEVLFCENETGRAAQRLEETALGRFFSVAIEQLDQWHEEVADRSSLTWLHCRGLVGAWDAPLELRADMLDEDDPLPAEFIEPPTGLRGIDDPDVLLLHRVAYAAQVKVLDACVGAFVAAAEQRFADCRALITLVGSRGFALGEHGAIGSDSGELYGECLHLPWLLYPCGNTAPLPRLASLVQPADIGSTLLDFLGLDPLALQGATTTDGISLAPGLASDEIAMRQLALAAGAQGDFAIRTPAWLLKQGPANAHDARSVELYTKPDDRWECNEVAGLCPAVTQQLREELANFELCGRSGQPLPLAPQDSELLASSR